MNHVSDFTACEIQACWEAGPEWDGNLGVQPTSPIHAVWSRDGQTIAFNNAGDRTSSGGIWTVPAAGGTPTQIAKNSSKGFANTEHHSQLWSPDSAFLTYRTTQRSNSLQMSADMLRVPAAGGTVFNLTSDVTNFPNPIRWVSNTVAP